MAGEILWTYDQICNDARRNYKTSYMWGRRYQHLNNVRFNGRHRPTAVARAEAKRARKAARLEYLKACGGFRR